MGLQPRIDSVPELLVDERLVFRVSIDVPGYEGADRDDGPSLGPHVVERIPSQNRAEPLAREARLDLGVDEEVATTTNVIDRETRDDAVDLDYVTVVFRFISCFHLRQGSVSALIQGLFSQQNRSHVGSHRGHLTDKPLDLDQTRLRGRTLSQR